MYLGAKTTITLVPLGTTARCDLRQQKVSNDGLLVGVTQPAVVLVVAFWPKQTVQVCYVSFISVLVA